MVVLTRKRGGASSNIAPTTPKLFSGKTEIEAIRFIEEHHDLFLAPTDVPSFIQALRSSWSNPTEQSSFLQGMANGIVYLNLLEKAKLGVDLMDELSAFLLTSCNHRVVEDSKLVGIALTKMWEFIKMHAVSSICVSRIIQLCLKRLDEKTLIEMAASSHRESILYSLKEFIASCSTTASVRIISFLASLLIGLTEETAGGYFGKREVPSVLFPLFKPDQYCMLVKEFCKRLHKPQHAVTCLFLLQIVTLFAMHNLAIDGGDKVCAILAEEMRIETDYNNQKKGILSCELLLNKEPSSCPECARDGMTMGFFSTCGICEKKIACNDCASCPVRVEKVGGAESKVCWGCGYKSIILSSLSGAEDQDSVMGCTDETVIALSLVLVSPHLNDPAKRFLREYMKNTVASLPGWVDKLKTTTSCFVPSEEFLHSIIVKLILSDRIVLIRKHLFKALISTPHPTPNSVNALSFFLTSVPERDIVREYILTLLESIDVVSNVKLLNAVLHCIAAPVSEDIVNVLLCMLYEEKLSLSSKKLVFNILLGSSAIESLVEYLSVGELSQPDCDALVDHACAFAAQEEGEEEILTKLVLCAQWPLIERISMKIPFDCIFSLIIIGFKKRTTSGSLKAALIILQHRRPDNHDSSMKGEVERILCDIISTTSKESDLVTACEALALFPCTNKNIQFANIVNNKLIPMLVSGSSWAVRAAAKLISRMVSPLQIAAVVEKFNSDFTKNNADVVRACWVLGSLPKELVPEKIHADIFEYILAAQEQETFGAVIAVVGFLVQAASCQSGLLSDLRLIALLKKGLTLFPFRTLQTVCGIMEQGLLVLPPRQNSAATKRPDGGIACRSFSDLFPLIETILLDPNLASETTLLALKAIDLMDRLGIVNRRLLPPLLFLRYLMTDSAITAVCFRMFTRMYDPKLRNAILPRIISNHHLLLFPENCLVHAVIRLAGFLFTPCPLVKREDMKSFIQFTVSQLSLFSKERKFLLLCAIAGFASLPNQDDKTALLANLREHQVARFEDTEGIVNPIEFLISEWSTLVEKKLNKYSFNALYDLLLQVSDRYSKNLALDPIPVSRKRARVSSGKPKRKKIKKPTANFDDEYTDGREDEEEETSHAENRFSNFQLT